MGWPCVVMSALKYKKTSLQPIRKTLVPLYCEWCDSPFFSSQVSQENLWIPMLLSVEEINRYLLLVFQFVLSMASAFAFGYLAPFYFYGTIAVGPRLLYGIISAFVVGMADLYFVIRHLLLMEGVIEKPTIDSRDNMIDSQSKKDSWLSFNTKFVIILSFR